MPKTKSTTIEKKICDAALKCAAAKDWSAITHDMIAKTAKLTAAQVKKIFPAIDDILPAIMQETTNEVTASVRKPVRGTPHDKLFEVLMARFDILQSHRKAVLNILDSVKRNPSLARVLLPSSAEAMQSVLALAGLEESGARDALAVAGLLTVYGVTLCTWYRDETEDMSKTMAALDQHLRRAEKLADILFRAF